MDRNQSEGRIRDAYDKLVLSQNHELANPDIDSYILKTHLFELLSRMESPKILDAGGGTGIWSIMLAHHGYDVTLLDVSPQSLEIARKNAAEFGLDFPIVQASVESTGLDGGEFDFAIAFGPITYTPNPGQMLAEMNRVLRPGGLLWVDYYGSLGSAIHMGLELLGLDKILEIALADEGWLFNPDLQIPERTFSHSRMEELLHAHGFEVVRKIGDRVIDLQLPYDADLSHPEIGEKLERIREIELVLSKDESCFATAGHPVMVVKKC